MIRPTGGRSPTERWHTAGTSLTGRWQVADGSLSRGPRSAGTRLPSDGSALSADDRVMRQWHPVQ
ncbi:hypothetical protein ADL00_25840 [Streptomyces sp. AS58]|uniref:Uncharacterized protein n=1 Tax=Streptomyces cadmiisoli TaxID=2184053 RepID=A0A2Z4IUG9_9ACTN|nr:hypothetical protein DN051_06535 [Streptomyces cadmiisoli]KOV58978.1 hypothetical protein ADL00_25840 [Streptomyces sp. AS58]